MSIETLTFAMEDRLAAFSASGDPAVLRGPEAQQLAERLYYAIDWLAPQTEKVETARAFNVAVLLASFHWQRFQYDGSDADAGRGGLFYKMVSQVAPHCVPTDLLEVFMEQGEPIRDTPTSQLTALTARGVSLLKEAEINGDARLLDDAVALCLFAVRANPRQDVVWAESLIMLGNVLTRRYEYTGDADSLTRAYNVTLMAEDVLPEGDPYRPKCFSTLGHIAIRLYEREGDLDRLDLAIRALREAAYGAPGYDQYRAAYLTNLATALSQHYGHTGRFESATEALEAQFEAVRTTPRDHPDLPSRLMNLAAALQGHPGTVPNGVDRHDEAAAHIRHALSLTTDGHPDRPRGLRLLAGVLQKRFTSKHDPRDLTDAVEAGRAAVEACGVGSYQRPYLLRGFAEALMAYADHFSAVDQLDEAIGALREADALLPKDHPYRRDTLMTLGYALRDRAGADPADREQALQALRDASSITSAPARDRAWAAVAAGYLAADSEDFTGAVESFTLALEQLELTAWRGLDRADRERLIAEHPNLVAHAAAVAVRADRAERAVELIEQGRGILLAQALEARTDHSELRALAPELDHRLRQVLDELDRLPDGSYSTAAEEVHERRRANDRRAALAREREEVLADIRKVSDLADFLRPRPFAKLLVAAERGPVVLLCASRYGCYALLLSGAGVQVLDLKLDERHVANRVIRFTRAVDGEPSPLRASEALVDGLSWLWAVVAKPVLEALGHTKPIGPGTEWPRLWWCPTGLFTLLPMHAAGHHRPESGGDAVLDRVVSSYTPTLRALLYTRTHPPKHPLTHPRPPSAREAARGLIVSMPSTPGWPDLPAAEQEARAVHRRHPDAELVTGPAATAPSVREALTHCSWAHFACHGRQDLGHPSRGALILHDGPLTLRDIVNLRLPHAQFAFLSACETSRGGIVLADEAISFATALQLAGFRDVVGTLWSIDDTLASDITDLVYEHMSRRPAPNPATALHAALHAVRAHHPDDVMGWAPYVHVGP
ncbi:CHAT domain-containing protein [Streptomyces pacificus]|uniref:CHAT domain-containing protein n=1 Tax=Streptomyces pacificus TaxID=2705029 RepID=A0A6A0B2E8_9ACTN|nr:CHAT domain-containing protein [Streptomyces pacificus]GFH38494.1 CHAT domain-containing protein [Streptomyces pacificus]